MLVSLYIRDFGLIDEVLLEPGPGLNVLTGETGAGKSIILDALAMALGGRSSADYIRTGRDKALVQAGWQLAEASPLTELLAARGVFPPGEDLLLMSRELSRSGRNQCRIGGQPVNLATFREVGNLLADLQGQNEQQSLLRSDRQRLLLDCFAGPGAAALLERCGSMYRAWRKAGQALAEVTGNQEEIARRLDFLQYQVNEIDAATLQLGEEDALRQERKILVNAERIAGLGERVYQSLYAGEQGGPSAVDLLSRSVQHLEELVTLDPSFKELSDQVQTALFQVEDAARELAGRKDALKPNPARLQEVEDRLYTIGRLQKKYGASVAAILAYRDKTAAEAAQLVACSSRAEELAREEQDLANQWLAVARELTGVRQEAAAGLEGELKQILKQLGMAGVELAIDLNTGAEPSAHGLDRVDFMISPNPGEPLRPLAKIASGGELSRVLLAFKTVLAKVDDIPTMVFDEVDTGIGGEVLRAVGENLAQVARHRQVICVTHAPRLAARASVHFGIIKQSTEAVTKISVTRLEDDQRVDELARMLGGNQPGTTVLEHARQMLLNLA
jgi:DNA repair protein RecN (Recombination protein N)